MKSHGAIVCNFRIHFGVYALDMSSVYHGSHDRIRTCVFNSGYGYSLRRAARLRANDGLPYDSKMSIAPNRIGCLHDSATSSLMNVTISLMWPHPMHFQTGDSEARYGQWHMQHPSICFLAGAY